MSRSEEIAARRADAERHSRRMRLADSAEELLSLLVMAEKCIAAVVRIEQTAPDEPPFPVSEWDFEADRLVGEIRAAIRKASGETA